MADRRGARRNEGRALRGALRRTHAFTQEQNDRRSRPYCIGVALPRRSGAPVQHGQPQRHGRVQHRGRRHPGVPPARRDDRERRQPGARHVGIARWHRAPHRDGTRERDRGVAAEPRLSEPEPGAIELPRRAPGSARRSGGRAGPWARRPACRRRARLRGRAADRPRVGSVRGSERGAHRRRRARHRLWCAGGPARRKLSDPGGIGELDASHAAAHPVRQPGSRVRYRRPVRVQHGLEGGQLSRGRELEVRARGSRGRARHRSLQGDTVVGEGFHAEYGGPHAEVAALAAAGARARGATLIVTLEPCAHYGKTPPCTDAIVAAGVARVVAAIRDPDPEARGGADVLRAQGVAVSFGVLAEAAAALNAPFLFAHQQAERPFVALKLATSIDGRIADARGSSRWVSGEAAREYVHWLRAGFDAIAVGGTTALKDDPQLTVRGPIPPRRAPVRVVFDRRAMLNETVNLVSTARTVPTWVMASPDAPVAR